MDGVAGIDAPGLTSRVTNEQGGSMHLIDRTSTGDLASAFAALFDRADNDQWELAHIAHAATKRSDISVADFAEMVGKAPDTITKYRIAYGWRRRNLHDHGDARFADAAALVVTAGVNDIDLETATNAHHDKAVAAVRDLINENPDLMIEAMDDDGTRESIISHAFEAAKIGIVEAAERITKNDGVGRDHAGSVKTRLAVFQGDAEGPMCGIARDIHEDWPEMEISDREAVRSFIKKFEVRLRALRIAARF